MTKNIDLGIIPDSTMSENYKQEHMEESKGAHRNMTPLLSFLFVRRNGYEEDRTYHQTGEA